MADQIAARVLAHHKDFADLDEIWLRLCESLESSVLDSLSDTSSDDELDDLLDTYTAAYSVHTTRGACVAQQQPSADAYPLAEQIDEILCSGHRAKPPPAYRSLLSHKLSMIIEASEPALVSCDNKDASGVDSDLPHSRRALRRRPRLQISTADPYSPGESHQLLPATAVTTPIPRQEHADLCHGTWALPPGTCDPEPSSTVHNSWPASNRQKPKRRGTLSVIKRIITATRKASAQNGVPISPVSPDPIAFMRPTSPTVLHTSLPRHVLTPTSLK